MTLREIAEKLNEPHPSGAALGNRYGISHAEVATLLHAVVEERAKYLDLLYGYSPLVHLDHITQALNELNLKGAWPGEGE